MKTPLELLHSAWTVADRLTAAAASPAGLRAVLERVKARLTPPPAPAAAGPVKLDEKLLQSATQTLRQMLEEIEQLEKDLPADARPIGLAARSLVERSLEECTKPLVDAKQLASDMQAVGQLALAMRERLLLSPWERKNLPPN